MIANLEYVYSFICYTAICGPKGHGSCLPLPSRTAAEFSLPYTRLNPVPTTMGHYWDNPISYYLSPPNKGKVKMRQRKGRQKKGTEENTV